ncbi:MAG TPA: FtsX-like permease family protein, partial [Caulobacteraceae bacterium]|nr:FtsX-like permease family protein [Caulobacteraceae bacterium]
HLVWAGVWRRPGRATLTLLSIVNAFLLFGLLEGFASGLTHAQAEAHADILFTTSRISTNEMMPTSLVERFRSAPGVRDVSPVLGLAAYYQRPGQFVRAYAVYPDEVPQIMPAMQIAPSAIQAFRAARDATIVSNELMKQYGWKIGDRIPLTSVLWQNKDGGRSWRYTIVGAFSAPTSLTLRNSMQTNYDYLDQSRTKSVGMTNTFLVRVADPTKAPAVAASLDALTRNSPYETKTQSEAQFARDSVQGIGDVGLLVNGIVGAVFFTLLISVGGVMAESARERTRDLGVLKALGFTDGGVLAIALSETTLVCVFAALAGLAIAGWIFPMATRLIGFTAVQQGPVFVEGLAVALALALAAGLPPALRALRLPVVDALADRP